MNWYKKYFSAEDISNGYDKKMEELLIATLTDPQAPDSSIYLASYKTEPGANGAFTAYFSEEMVDLFPHLESNYVLERCDKPDHTSVKTWVGIEPLASLRLQRS